MGEVIIFVDDFDTQSIAYNNNNKNCRICHEAEFESSRELEVPCSCSGTVKYAHRECIQRWCDEKGDIICEICLKKYEPGYTAKPKQAKKNMVLNQVVSIRASLEAGRREEQVGRQDISECSTSIDGPALYCKRFALLITALLLLRHLIEVLAGATNYPFSPATVLILRSCGVLVPMCIIIWTITLIQNSLRRRRNFHDALIQNNDVEESGNDEEQANQR